MRICVVCCIYHAPHTAGESSSESSSDSDSSDSDSDSDSTGGDDGRVRMGGLGATSGRRKHSHRHIEGEEGCTHEQGGEDTTNTKKKGAAKAKQVKPNAYEAVPHTKSKKVEKKS